MTQPSPRTQRFMQRVPRLAAVMAVAAAFVLASLTSARPASAAVTAKETDESIKKAVQFLKASQKDGNWEVVPKPDPEEPGHSVKGGNWGGLTAMATYGLLAAGVDEQDEVIKKAVAWLSDAKIVGTYSIALRAQVWLLLDKKGPYKKEIAAGVKRDFKILTALMYTKKEDGEKQGFYTYHLDYNGNKVANGHYDRSNSQYGVLGVWAIEQVGIQEVPQGYWQMVDEAWKKTQNADGGWEYTGQADSTPTMATAGLATLFVTQDYLLGANAQCKGNIQNKHIDAGMAYMDKNIGQLVTSGNLYLMYGIERIGLASGRKYFGGVDWYARGAEWLVRNQRGDGSWGGGDDIHNPRGIPGTVWGLIFLVRGRAPVILNKLEYTSVAKEKAPTGWNQRPRDAAGLAKWMHQNTEDYFNWQIVDLKGSADDLHDSPILYIAGSEELAFKDEEVEKLRKFVEGGGIILGNTDCGRERQRFSKSFIALGKKLFPKYEFRDLPANHPIYVKQNFNANKNKWANKFKVQALSNEVRELMILIPNDDVAKAWQTRSDRMGEQKFQLSANIYLYATDKQFRYRGDSYIIKADPSVAPTRNAKVARLQVSGNWDPEPGAWRQVTNLLRNKHDLAVTVETVKLGDGKLAGGGYALAHLTGTGGLDLNKAARQELAAFVKAGGTLVIDAAGGNSDFADDAEKVLVEVFGEEKQLVNSLPVSHEVFDQGEGAKIEQVRYREFARAALGNAKAPRLKGIAPGGGRVRVFFSREDLTAGMVGQNVDGIYGYDPASATAIMRNIALYAASAPAAGGAPVAGADAEEAAAAAPGDDNLSEEADE